MWLDTPSIERIKGVKVNKLEYDNRKFNIIPLILQLVYIYNTKLPQIHVESHRLSNLIDESLILQIWISLEINNEIMQHDNKTMKSWR